MSKQLSHAEGFDPRKIRRRTTLGAVGAGLLALVLVVAVFWLSIRYYSLVDTYQAGGNAGPINWDKLGGITSLATFSLFFGGVVFALFEYIQNAVQKKREDAEASFNIYKEMYSRLMNPEALEARRWVIVNLPTLEDVGNDQVAWLKRVTAKINRVPRGWKGKRSPGQEYLKDILNTFDFIGFVARHYWNMENELVVWMSPPVAKVWERISVYVEDEAIRRDEKDYYKSAREFANYCVEWRRKNNFPPSKVIKNGT